MNHQVALLLANFPMNETMHLQVHFLGISDFPSEKKPPRVNRNAQNIHDY